MLNHALDMSIYQVPDVADDSSWDEAGHPLAEAEAEAAPVWRAAGRRRRRRSLARAAQRDVEQRMPWLVSIRKPDEGVAPF